MYQQPESISALYRGSGHGIVIPQIRIEFADPKEIRSRKIVRRSNSKPTGKYPGRKAGRSMQWESPHEENAMRLLDACPVVKNFNEQPAIIHYQLNGVVHKHFPDLLVKLANRREFWEIKTPLDGAKPEVIERTAFLTEHLPAYGYTYRLLLSDLFDNKILQSNAEAILRMGTHIQMSPLQRETVIQLFKTYETLPFGSFLNDPDHREMARHVCKLILEGVLSYDQSKKLSDNTAIRWVFNQQLEGEESWQFLISKKA